MPARKPTTAGPRTSPIPWPLDCDHCGEPITDGHEGLVRWCDDPPRIDVVHKCYVTPRACDSVLERAHPHACPFDVATFYGAGDKPDPIHAASLMLYIQQTCGDVFGHRWRELFLRLTVRGFEQARHLLTPEVCRDIGIPPIEQEVARICPEFCDWVLREYGG